MKCLARTTARGWFCGPARAHSHMALARGMIMVPQESTFPLFGTRGSPGDNRAAAESVNWEFPLWTPSRPATYTRPPWNATGNGVCSFPCLKAPHKASVSDSGELASLEAGPISTTTCNTSCVRAPIAKILSGANAFEISNIQEDETEP